MLSNSLSGLTILKYDHPSQVWFNLVQYVMKSRFKFCFFNQNMHNLHNRYKSTERKNRQIDRTKEQEK
jgi:hypothetical protein